MSVKCHPEEHRWLCSCWVFVSIGIVFPSFGIVPLVSLGIVLSVSRFDDKQTVDWFRPYLLPSHLKSAQNLNAWRLLLQLSHFSNPPFLCGKLQDPKVWHLLLPLYQFWKCQPLPPSTNVPDKCHCGFSSWSEFQIPSFLNWCRRLSILVPVLSALWISWNVTFLVYHTLPYIFILLKFQPDEIHFWSWTVHRLSILLLDVNN